MAAGASTAAEGSAVSPSRPFILRPVATSLLMVAVLLLPGASGPTSFPSRRCRR